MRERYRFGVVGYVVMPEHVHILISEPQIGDPSTVVQAVKLGFTQRWRATGRFWQRRFYDFNVWSQRKEVEKLKYMHRNPVVRGLVEKPEDWRWSSYRSYAYGEDGLVRINDWKWWEEKIRTRRGEGVTEVVRKAPLLAQRTREKWGTRHPAGWTGPGSLQLNRCGRRISLRRGTAPRGRRLRDIDAPLRGRSGAGA